MEIAETCHEPNFITIGILRPGTVFVYRSIFILITNSIHHTPDSVACVELCSGKMVTIDLNIKVLPRLDLHLAPIKEVSS